MSKGLTLNSADSVFNYNADFGKRTRSGDLQLQGWLSIGSGVTRAKSCSNWGNYRDSSVLRFTHHTTYQPLFHYGKYEIEVEDLQYIDHKDVDLFPFVSWDLFTEVQEWNAHQFRVTDLSGGSIRWRQDCVHSCMLINHQASLNMHRWTSRWQPLR
jgi:hypothetical protein